MDLSGLQTVLTELGINIAANAIYDFLRSRLTSCTPVETRAVEAELASFLRVHGVSVSASKVLTMLAAKGFLSIQGSYLYATKQITMGAAPGAAFVFGNNSISRTKNTAIEAGAGAFIQGSNAAVVQDPAGSISFHVGKDDKSR